MNKKIQKMQILLNFVQIKHFFAFSSNKVSEWFFFQWFWQKNTKIQACPAAELLFFSTEDFLQATLAGKGEAMLS